MSLLDLIPIEHFFDMDFEGFVLEFVQRVIDQLISQTTCVYESRRSAHYRVQLETTQTNPGSFRPENADSNLRISTYTVRLSISDHIKYSESVGFIYVPFANEIAEIWVCSFFELCARN